MRAPTLVLGFLAISLALAQQAPPPYDPGQDAGGPLDEPGRPVARLSVLSGDASLRRGDSGDWLAAALNAPLMVGDSVSVAPGGAVEVQLDGANFARVAGDSEVRVSEFEAGRIQLQLMKGLVTWRVLRQTSAQTEISTPLAAIHPLGLASARVEIAPDGTIRVIVRHGDVEVSTRSGSERVHEGNVMLVMGSVDDPAFQTVTAPPIDQWDTWSDQRDAYLTRAQSPRYLSQDIYGAEDLDGYGRWSNDPAYGEVWTPRVPASWAPYREGRWVWEDYYGWTWVDASPWGWAPFHYGSWYYRTGLGWSWFPGRRYDRVWYRPALVGFFGYGNAGVGFGFGNIGWIPLAPYERFHPWYGRGGWGGRNAFANNVNVYRNTNITNVYRNARFSNGISAVSGADFQRGNFHNYLPVGGAQLQQASLVRGALPLTPGAEHLRFSDRAPGAASPRTNPGNQRFFSRMPASSSTAQRVPFAQQQSAMRSSFGGNNGSLGNAPEGRRFGSASTPGAPGAGSASPGWQRFGNPQTAPQANGFAGSPGLTGGSRFGGQARSLEVAPPIVQERGIAPAGAYRAAPPASQPHYSRPSYNQAPAPQYRAPASNPNPGNYRGGGSGFGAPVYRSAPAAPSAPRSAPSYAGGGGGGSRVGGGANRVSGGGSSGAHGNRR